YGAVTALPLMFEVIDSLPRARTDGMPSPPPSNVAETEICWPLGLQPELDAPQLCQRRMKAWILDGATPTTFAERDARPWNAGRERFEVDATSGLRLSGECSKPHAAVAAEIARWPALASPWLSAQVRRQSQLPALSPDCVADGRDAATELRIQGLNDRATIARAPGSTHGARLQVRAVGTEGKVQWLLDGKWIAETTGARPFQRDYGEPGEHTLTALAESGAWTRIGFRVLR
ncbi:MAG: penicillin-binding protein 1C, partial [Oxalobacteraceae bacterium]